MQGCRGVSDAPGHVLRGRRGAACAALHQRAHQAPGLALPRRLRHGLRLHSGGPRAQPAQAAGHPGTPATNHVDK